MASAQPAPIAAGISLFGTPYDPFGIFGHVAEPSQSAIERLFEGSHVKFEEYIVQLRDKDESAWKHTMLEAIKPSKADGRGFNLIHVTAKFNDRILARDIIKAAIERYCM